MTPEQIDRIRITAHFLVLENAVIALYAALAEAHPKSFAPSALESADRWRRSANLTAFPWATPENADLLNQEYLDVLERFLTPLEQALRKAIAGG